MALGGSGPLDCHDLGKPMEFSAVGFCSFAQDIFSDHSIQSARVSKDPVCWLGMKDETKMRQISTIGIYRI